MRYMGWNEEILTPPPADATARAIALFMADGTGREQTVTFSKTIDAHAAPHAANEQPGCLNVTVNVLNVMLSWKGRVGFDPNGRRVASSRYWMDSLPCLANRR